MLKVSILDAIEHLGRAGIAILNDTDLKTSDPQLYFKLKDACIVLAKRGDEENS